VEHMRYRVEAEVKLQAEMGSWGCHRRDCLASYVAVVSDKSQFRVLYDVTHMGP
jgi:hypothetical protein